MITLTAGQWTLLFFLAAALLFAAGWQVVCRAIEGPRELPANTKSRLGLVFTGQPASRWRKSRQDVPGPALPQSSSLAANEGPTGPGAPNGTDWRATSVLWAGNCAIAEARDLIARAAGLLAVTA